MRVLIYKRTHDGDPDESGRFGANDCMGKVRNCEYDAVIGVGALGAEAQRHEIDGKVNWIGIGPHKEVSRTMRGPVVTFDHFLDFGSEGPTFEGKLACRMYKQNIRYLITGIHDNETAEVERILDLARGAKPSQARVGSRQRKKSKSSCVTHSRASGCM